MAAAPTASPSRWMYGPAPDLLIGCGLWYAIVFVALATFGNEIRTGGGAVLLPFLVLAFGTPHYGATLIRVYQRREDRRTYAVFGVYASAILAAAFVVGIYDVTVGSWILTLYLTWSPWHYTGQNYGIGVMFLRRRGVLVTPVLKRFLYAAFLLSYLLVFLALHSGSEATDYTPVVAYDPATYSFRSIDLPARASAIVFGGVVVAYLVALVGTVGLLLRRARLRDIAPTLVLIAIQALWFTIPLLLRRWELTPGIEPWRDGFGSYYFTWIAVGHSLQYLWITSYYARGNANADGQLRYYLRVMLAGAAIWTLPAIAFAPGALGRLPFDAGLGVLIAATVNLHHFVLDGAIWKLRDGRIARILMRTREPVAAAAPVQAPRERWFGRCVYALGAACFLVMFTAKWERESFRQALRAGDISRISSSLDRLSEIGRESAKGRLLQGDVFKKSGNTLAATHAYRRSLDLHPTSRGWISLAKLLRLEGDWAGAADALEQALAIDPARDLVLHELGLARLKLDQPERARAAFAQAAELNPDRNIHRVMLERAEQQIRDARVSPEDSTGS